MTVVTNYGDRMAVDASGPRAKLVAAGERLFASQGIHGAQMRDVVRAAGQANDSAVHYHFGSRAGLLAAICQWHIDAMEPERVRRLATQASAPELDTVVADLVRPTAERLQTQEGRYFLRIAAQLAGHAGVRSGSVPHPIMSRALRTQLEQLQQLCAASMPVDVAGERAFVANLEAMLAAALKAPVPAVTA